MGPFGLDLFDLLRGRDYRRAVTADNWMNLLLILAALLAVLLIYIDVFDGKTGFASCLMYLVVLASITIVREYRRTRSFSLLSILSVGNILYNAVTPAMSYYWPGSADAFERYVADAGMTVHETGLIRVLLAAMIFQFVILFVSSRGSQKSGPFCVDAINDQAVLDASLTVGWLMLLIGAAGVIWMGLKYNGHAFGLYEILYADRSPLFRENSLQAFMILLGMYGAAQLIVVSLLSDRINLAVLILIGMTLHGLGMKSKFPVFWILIIFVAVAIERRKEIFCLLLPIGFSALVISTMSILRGARSLSEFPQYVMDNIGAFGSYATKPWNNDLPGPASITYYVMNSEVDFSIAPITDALMILIPKFLLNRSPLLSEVYAERMMGAKYAPGQGFGWSLICDGYLFAGWVGICLVAVIIAMLARYIEGRKIKSSGQLREFFTIVCYSSVPIFLYNVRESAGGLFKSLLIMTVLIWLPTLFLARTELLRALKVSDGPGALHNDPTKSAIHESSSN